MCLVSLSTCQLCLLDRAHSYIRVTAGNFLQGIQEAHVKYAPKVLETLLYTHSVLN